MKDCIITTLLHFEIVLKNIMISMPHC